MHHEMRYSDISVGTAMGQGLEADESGFGPPSVLKLMQWDPAASWPFTSTTADIKNAWSNSFAHTSLGRLYLNLCHGFSQVFHEFASYFLRNICRIAVCNATQGPRPGCALLRHTVGLWPAASYGWTLATSVLSRAVKPRACQMVSLLRLYVHKMEETRARMYIYRPRWLRCHFVTPESSRYSALHNMDYWASLDKLQRNKFILFKPRQ
jgi:hypothetical protein